MKRTGKGPPHSVVALALTWDGARWPTKAFPPKARAFLMGTSGKASIPPSSQLAKAFACDEIKECRICWVPRLKGGKNVLAETFAIPTGKRISFQVVKSVRFGEILGVTYRRP